MNATNLKSALFSGVFAAGVAALIAVGVYILKVGDVFLLDWHAIINVAVLAFISAILASLGKNSLTNTEGKALGVQVK